MQAEPQAEHQWLEQLIGEWTYESRGEGCPDAWTGTESVRSIGGVWVQCEGRGEMPGGGSATMMITLGYDPLKGRYVGTWIGSMMTYFWVYEGDMDSETNTLTLSAEGPSFTEEGKMGQYRDIIQIKSPDHHVMTSHTLREDGTWHNFMTADYRRVK